MRTHGRVATYTAGCRCGECRAAARAHRRELRDRLRDPGPCRRHSYIRDFEELPTCRFCGAPR